MKFLALLVMVASFVFGAVDINNANIKELTTLNGVGISKAKAIVSYREKHCFKKVDDIIQVKGLGAKFLEKNRKNMKIGACKK
ncbi:ComEA family DNA-binding protein [Sulfurospirillum sp. 1612]|uniref:ComEA family DNA-binding protein n=1 Tax=Sulfurospirillum sp. 1612 TaxID=3094835 RepID=UPI002F954039